MDTVQYDFDPAYGYTLKQLLTVTPPTEPKDFDTFWKHRYQKAIQINPRPRTKIINENINGWRVFAISYTSTNDFQIHGWLLVPVTGIVKRGFIIGHGYGGRDQPDYHLPFNDAAMLFPCFRGLGLSAQPTLPSDAYTHVLQDIEDKDRYILGGCVEDLWLAVSSMLSIFPRTAGHLGYLGMSFGGGIGALALAWETRVAKGHLNVPSFTHHPLRLRLATTGSAHSIQQYYQNHKKSTLAVLRYFDATLAAKRIRIPLHCACAIYDPCVAPPGQFSLYNALTGTKQLFVLTAGHHSYPTQATQEAELITEINTFFASL